MGARRVDEDRERGVSSFGFALQTILHADHGWNFVQDFRDANDRNFVVVGDQFDPRFSHARATHSEKFRSGARAQGSGQPRGIHVTGCFSRGNQNILFSHGKREGNRAASVPLRRNFVKQPNRKLKLAEYFLIIGREWMRESSPAAEHWRREFLLFVLQLIETVINFAQREKLLMRSLFAQAALVEDKDTVRVLNRAQAVRDHDGCAALQEPVEGFADQELGLSVHAGGSFVENQKFWVVRQSTRETYELALAHGKRGSTLGDRRLHSLRLRFEERTEPYFAQGAYSGGAAYRLRAPLDVGFQRAGEKEWVLQDDSEKST